MVGVTACFTVMNVSNKASQITYQFTDAFNNIKDGMHTGSCNPGAVAIAFYRLVCFLAINCHFYRQLGASDSDDIDKRGTISSPQIHSTGYRVRQPWSMTTQMVSTGWQTIEI